MVAADERQGFGRRAAVAAPRGHTAPLHDVALRADFVGPMDARGPHNTTSVKKQNAGALLAHHNARDSHISKQSASTRSSICSLPLALARVLAGRLAGGLPCVAELVTVGDRRKRWEASAG